MRRQETASEKCPVAAALSVLGDKWTLLILRDAFNGVRRFEDFERHLGVSRPLLARRLKRLLADRILERRPYRAEGARTRHEYRLTGKGRDLRFILVALREWGDKHADGDFDPPLELVERDTGAPVRLRLARVSDGAPVDPRAVTGRVAGRRPDAAGWSK